MTPPLGWGFLNQSKHIINSSDLLNDQVILFFDQHDISAVQVLTYRSTEFFGRAYAHDCEMFLALKPPDHSRTKANSPQTNGICERFQKTVLDEFYRIAFRRKIYTTLEELLKDLNEWPGNCTAILNVLIKANGAKEGPPW